RRGRHPVVAVAEQVPEHAPLTYTLERGHIAAVVNQAIGDVAAPDYVRLEAPFLEAGRARLAEHDRLGPEATLQLPLGLGGQEVAQDFPGPEVTVVEHEGAANLEHR